MTNGKITMAPERAPKAATKINNEWSGAISMANGFIRIDARRTLVRKSGVTASAAAISRQFEQSPEFKMLATARERLAEARARLKTANVDRKTSHERLAVAAIATGKQSEINAAQKAQAKAKADAELAEAEIEAIEGELPRLWDAARNACFAFHAAARQQRESQGRQDYDAAVTATLAALAPFLDQLILAHEHFDRGPEVDPTTVLGPRPAAPAESATPASDGVPILADNRLKPEHRAPIIAPEPSPSLPEFAFGGHGNGKPWYDSGMP